MPLEYSNIDLMIISAARALPETAVVFITGDYSRAMVQVGRALGKNITAIFESGRVEAVSENKDGHLHEEEIFRGDSVVSFQEILQGGYVDVGCIEIVDGQVDAYANVKLTHHGKYKNPKGRYGGGGVASDLACLAKKTFLFAPQKKEVFRSCDFITAPGYFNGGNSREKIGLIGGGPEYLFSDQAVFDFEGKGRRARLLAVYSGIAEAEVLKNMSFKPTRLVEAEIVDLPTAIELKALK